jgi:hypothetical protein
MKESLAYWKGTDTDTRFARHQQTFRSLTATIRNKAASLLRRGLSSVLPAPNDEVVTMPVDEFIRRTPSLRQQWSFLERRAASDPDLRAAMSEFLEGRAQAGAREVGSRRPDIVEFFLSDVPAESRIIVTDVTTAITPLHLFKTAFYREVLVALLGGQGPQVFGVDVDIATIPVSPTVVVP